MLQRIRQMLDEIPAYMGQIIKFACLTGLRPAEAVQSVKLINDKDSFAKYYNPQRQAFGYWMNNAAAARLQRLVDDDDGDDSALVAQPAERRGKVHDDETNKALAGNRTLDLRSSPLLLLRKQERGITKPSLCRLSY
jgi:hypothetical protein